MEYSSALRILIILTAANAEKYTGLDNPPLYEDITDVDYATEFEKRGTPNSNIWRFPWQYEVLDFQGNVLDDHIQTAEKILFGSLPRYLIIIFSFRYRRMH